MIYVNGDSWSRNLWIDWSPVDWSWPKQMQDQITVPVLNESVGCGSNGRILSKLQQNYYLGKQFDLVIVALTVYSRWHIPSKNLSTWNIGRYVMNDEKYSFDETILPWWLTNVYDRIEFVYQYYNIIWQINELCKNYLKCPVIFFNAWDTEIPMFDEMIFSDDNNLLKWLESNKSNDATDEIVSRYFNLFKFLQTDRNQWNFEITPWRSFLNKSHYDGPNDRDPHHPNQEGHRLISEQVLSTINKHFPTLYQKFKV